MRDASLTDDKEQKKKELEGNKELLCRATQGDKRAREQLVTENMGLVYSVARRFLNRGYDLEDLFQIGCIGLMKSIDKFDTAFDVKFSTYAVPMITGEIKRFLRDDGMIKVSRTLKENAGKAHKAREKFVNEQGREPTISELAACVELQEEELVEALDANSEVESIYKTIYQSDGSDICLVDKLEEKVNENEQLLNKMTIGSLMEHLEEREQEMIRLRYYEEKTQTEIAKLMGVSQVQISRMEKKILAKLRKELN